MEYTTSVNRHDPQGRLTLSTQVFVEGTPSGEDSTERSPERFPELYRKLRGEDAAFNVAHAMGGASNNVFIEPYDRHASEGVALLPVCHMRDDRWVSGHPQPMVVSDLAILGHQIETGPNGVGTANYNYFEWYPNRYNFYMTSRSLAAADVAANTEADPKELFRFGPLGNLLVAYMTYARKATIEQTVMTGATHLPTVVQRGKVSILNFNHQEVTAGQPLLLDVPVPEEMERIIAGARDPLMRDDLLSEQKATHKFVPWVPVTPDQYVRRHGRTRGFVPALVFNQMYFGVVLRDASPFESMQVLVGKPPGPDCM